MLNDNNFHSSGWGSYRQMHNVLRPFAYEQPEEAWNGSNYSGTTRASENFGIVFPNIANKAFKSTDNVGGSDINVTVIYVDQDGNIETASHSTRIPADILKDTLIDVTLNSGDTGVKDVIGVSITGGVAGDAFELHLFCG